MTAGPKCTRRGCSNTVRKVRGKYPKYCAACRTDQKRRAHDGRVESVDFTGSDYWRLYEAQDGHCAIKGCRANGRTRFLSVEHDHKCTRGHDPKVWCRYCVRGLTCGMHNGWLGKAADDPEVFDSLADYLRNPPARKVLT